MGSSPGDNQKRVIACRDWDHFISAVRVSADGIRTRVFRGQRDVTWQLASVWERFLSDQQKKGNRVQRGTLLDAKLAAFRDCAIGLPDVLRADLNDDLECWALGRHHGLVTPLLDWTRSPYVAAFFAWMDYHHDRNKDLASWGAAPMKWGDGEVAVWELSDAESLANSDEFQLFTSRADHARRQKAQQGLFSILRHSELFDIEAYLISRGVAHKLTQYVIEGTGYSRAVTDLRLMNVSYATLFPDLEGAARQANIDAWLRLRETMEGGVGRQLGIR